MASRLALLAWALVAGAVHALQPPPTQQG